MRNSSAAGIAFAAAAVFGFGVGCFVDLPPDGKYICTGDADCGGDGYVCTPSIGAGPRFCCKPSGAETCDAVDNDCNGVTDDIPPNACYTGTSGTLNVGPCHGGTESCSDGGWVCVGEVVPRQELCNSADDDCNGVNDNGFDFRTDPNNCGICGRGCAQPLRCEDGGCAVPIETICNDNIDNDGDSARDCADSDCVGQSCGTGCVCRNQSRVETLCSDSQDNDTDSAADCADNDCDGGSCGTGCQCRTARKVELACGDTVDNDTDTATDCADLADCTGQSCGMGCTCAGGQKTETQCAPLSGDEDGDGTLNCMDSDCDGGTCGSGCLCASGSALETICFDIADNDSDSLQDCADPNCDGGSCVGGDAGCTCINGQKTEVNCLTTSGNEDGDANANCNDPDCLGKVCRTSPLRTCQAGGACQ